MADKIVSIKSVQTATKAKKETYEEVLKEHLKMLSQEQLDSEATVVFIAGLTSEGLVYSIAQGDCVVQVMGVLDCIKTQFFCDNV